MIVFRCTRILVRLKDSVKSLFRKKVHFHFCLLFRLTIVWDICLTRVLFIQQRISIRFLASNRLKCFRLQLRNVFAFIVKHIVAHMDCIKIEEKLCPTIEMN